MVFLWVIAAVSFLLAALAWNRARRVAARLEQVSQMYWELKYELGEQRVQIRRLGDPAQADGPPRPQPGPSHPDVFVPLASLKR